MTEAQAPTPPRERRSRVTVVRRTNNAYDLIDPPEEFAPGLAIEIEEGIVVLRVDVMATNGATSLQLGPEAADDFFGVVAASCAPYWRDPHDPRDEPI